MHPFAGQSAAELLRDLGAKLTKAAETLSYVPSISAMESLEDDLLVSLAMLRRRINRHKSSIYRLHPEILSTVVRHLKSKSDLVCATHVSYYLRSTLLSHPDLWAHLDFGDAGRGLVFLERSKSASLHVNLTGDGGNPPPSVEFLRPHTTRIVTLVLLDRPDQTELLSQPMPSLRRLEITDNLYDDDDFPHTPVDGEISWSLPSVTSLAVQNTYPITFHVPRLTCFKFHYADPMDDTFTLESLLDFLRECPLLEDLEISYTEDILDTDNQIISLPNLHTYTQKMIPGRGAYSLGVLDILSLPPSCTVTLKSWTDADVNDRMTDILPHLKDPTCLAGVRRIKLSITPIAFDFERCVIGTLELINDREGRVCLERKMRLIGTYQRRSIQDIVGSNLKFGLLNCLKDLDTKSTETLCIEVKELWDTGAPNVDSIKEAMGLLPNVKMLVLSHAAVKPCLLALEQIVSADGNGQGFPRLQTLIVHSHSVNRSGTDILQTLLLIAERRKAAGYPFKSVSVFLQNVLLISVNPEGSIRKRQELEELRRCIENSRLAVGYGSLDWNIDDYFLDGLDHLRNCRNVEWELEDDQYRTL